MTSIELPQQEDHVVLLDSVPHPAADAAEPFIVASDRRVILAYPIAESDFERFGPFDPDDDPFCAVLFPDTAFHRLGPPGDSDLGIHPLASQGLAGYSVHEVIASSLAAEIAAVASAELARRHFVLTFQASTFECVASDYTVVGVYGAGEIAIREAFSLVR
ncbi:hypothetical protein ACTJLC_21375 [Paraburkholderia sp. 22099]|jgi:hypothetical protein|uniref:Uncharacterized protein n=1 Tax=Paraburkholderia terricola TaxID=169427 RepID=A0A1M6S167_9BURK|nr:MULTISPECIES: hypothetical protein [Paraburkholderia]ORC52627.1 hypothetical protein B2G74_08745 [Burkholderia sp. A27]AXE94821.1 hypothetical protein CUJ90_20830 [Paraburkholderia terricola]MDR6444464.1 hypothetical protein [Paraburkholderia terricola]MDR6491447.1 hypothetical protein [Paraburkholderia terricola]SDO53507.1 hypothetical protein SAMN05192547_10197 [Paraburkholderia sediminicola]